MSTEHRSRRRWAGWLLAACVVAGLLVVAYPAWIIQPFRAQAPGQLGVALTMIRIAPVATVATLLAGLLAAIALGPRGWKRAALVAGAMVLLSVAAVLARVDYFEIMFRPDPIPRFVAADQSSFGPADMVLVAHVRSDAHAYPVRMMAYHHLVNDTVGGVPIVATY